MLWADHPRLSRETIEAGKWLVEAKASLPHGEFLPMVVGLAFGRTTAFRLLAVASHARLLDVAHGHHLPPSWRTLYEISKLDESEFDLGVERGVISPDVSAGRHTSHAPHTETTHATNAQGLRTAAFGRSTLHS